MIWLTLLGLLGVGMAFGDLGGSSGSGGQAQDGDDTDDLLEGGAGRDLLLGGEGDDTLLGHDAEDLLVGGNGNDLLEGGRDDDLLIGGAGNDTLHGGPGDDLLLDGAGDDLLQGAAGEDTLISFSGQDTLDGGAGDDLLIAVEMPEGATPATFGLGDMMASLEAELQSGMDQIFGAGAGAHAGTVLSEAFSAGPGVAGQTGDVLLGGAGNDLLVGDSADTMTGGAGQDNFIIAAERADHAYDHPDYVPVTITDYQAGEVVYLAYGQGPVPVLSQHQVGADVELRLDSHLVALVQGQQANAIAARAVTYSQAANMVV